MRLEELPAQGRGSRSDRPRWGWGSLTPTEDRVARVVAEGLTNAKVAERLFLSRHTVDFHLRQIYRKLGINSRVELARLVLEHPE
jgi:DNA-binding CsgD family transcriptional regulator